MPCAFIGLGSNLGDRGVNLANARAMLEEVEGLVITGESGVRETDPVDYLDQPRFLNQVLRIRTDIAPMALLEMLQGIEYSLGRVRNIPKGPRTIDLDILLYGGDIIETPALKIPHPQIRNRRFVLDQLLEIEPDLRDPFSGEPYREVAHGED